MTCILWLNDLINEKPPMLLCMFLWTLFSTLQNKMINFIPSDDTTGLYQTEPGIEEVEYVPSKDFYLELSRYA